MPPETDRRPSRPSKSSRRAKQTGQTGGQGRDAAKSSQIPSFMFVDVSDPNESRREEKRKACRSFVMKQYKQSQNSAASVAVEVDDDSDDDDEDTTTKFRGATSSSGLLESNADSPHSLSQPRGDNSSNETTDLLASRRLYVSSPDWDNAAHPIISPLSLLGNGSLDPFDSYPSRIEMPAHQLIDMCTF